MKVDSWLDQELQEECQYAKFDDCKTNNGEISQILVS